MPGIYLQFVRGTGEDGNVRTCPGSRFVVGRSAACDIRVRSSASSRRHAILELEDGVWLAKDLGSRNGLYVNSSRVERAEIRPLDTIQFGAKGPRIRILSLDPAPPMQGEEADSTRFFRAPGHEEEELEAIPIVEPETGTYPPRPPERAPARAPRRETEPPPDIGSEATTAEVAGKPDGGSFRLVLTLFLALVGAAFAIVMFTDAIFIPWLPSELVLAPVIWLGYGIAKGLPGLDLAIANAVVRGTTVLWFALFFAFFARPLRRWWLILIFAAIQGGAIFALLHFGRPY